MDGESGSGRSFSMFNSPAKEQNGEQCQGCAHHLSTIQFQNTQIESLTAIMKGLQQTIAVLVANNQQPVVTGGNTPVSMKRPYLDDGGSAASSKYSSSSSYTPSQKTRRPNPVPKTHVAKSSVSSTLARSLMKERRGKNMSQQPDDADGEGVRNTSTLLRTETLQDDSQDDVMTRIWITASPFVKIACPVADCPRRTFAAGDVYHFKRHFLQVHSKTHPNPSFVFQCPIVDCTEAYENSWKFIKDHMRSTHPEACPLVVRKKGRPIGSKTGANKEVAAVAGTGEEEPVEEEEEPDEDATAVLNLDSSPNGLPGAQATEEVGSDDD